MRWLVVVGLVAVVGCVAQPECTFDRDCAEFEVCERGSCFPDGNDGLRDCCDCLVDFECIDIDVDRCVSNIDGGGSISLAAGCSTDRSRCGSSCEDELDPVD